MGTLCANEEPDHGAVMMRQWVNNVTNIQDIELIGVTLVTHCNTSDTQTAWPVILILEVPRQSILEFAIASSRNVHVLTPQDVFLELITKAYMLDALLGLSPSPMSSMSSFSYCKEATKSFTL